MSLPHSNVSWTPPSMACFPHIVSFTWMTSSFSENLGGNTPTIYTLSFLDFARLAWRLNPPNADYYVPRLSIAATYIYKVKFSELAPRLRCVLPPPMLPPDTLRTRRQVSRTRRHRHQLTNPLSRDSPNYLKRSFPYSTIDFWNCLPASVFPTEHPTAKHMNTFKGRVNRHITDQPWSWDVV